MKPMDLIQFKKWISAEGYTIEATAKHHAVISPDEKDKARFAIHHQKGTKRYVKPIYIKRIQEFIEADKNRRNS